MSLSSACVLGHGALVGRAERLARGGLHPAGERRRHGGVRQWGRPHTSELERGTWTCERAAGHPLDPDIGLCWLI